MQEKLYRLIASSPSPFCFLRGDGLRLANENSEENDPVREYCADTIWQEFRPFSSIPFPIRLRISIDVLAQDFDDAIHSSDKILIGFTDSLAVCINAPIPNLEINAIIEGINEDTARAVREYSRHDNLPFPKSFRFLPASELCQSTIALLNLRSSDQVSLAMSHYKFALDNYSNRTLIFSFNHLCVAIEILGNHLLNLELDRRGLPHTSNSRKLLLNDFGVSEVESNWSYKLQNQFNIREMFSGNADLYRRVGRATNGFEHGDTDINAIRNTANETIKELFGIARGTIFRLANFDLLTSSVGEILPYENLSEVKLNEYQVPQGTTDLVNLRHQINEMTSDGNELKFKAQAFTIKYD